MKEKIMADKKETRKKRQTRAGKVQIGVWVEEGLYKKFQHLAIDLKLNVGILVEQAMQDYFDRHEQTKK